MNHSQAVEALKKLSSKILNSNISDDVLYANAIFYALSVLDRTEAGKMEKIIKGMPHEEIYSGSWVKNIATALQKYLRNE